LEIVASDITVDSENTLFYAVFVWLSCPLGPYEKPHSPPRRDLLPLILPHIRFPQMRIFFLLEVVYHVADVYIEFKDLIYKLADHAVECIIGGAQRLQRQTDSCFNAKIYVPRPIYPNSNKFTIKCEFRNISKLETTSRYYSAPVIAHGYEFYFFLRKQKIRPKNSSDDVDTKNETLAGYLRCTSKILPQKHFLPIRSIVAVTMSGEQSERKFVPSNVIFEASEKAIGGKLTLNDENWEQIITGKSPIIHNDTLTAIVTVEFLENDEGCHRIEETLE